jgi:hypothetical protein
MMHIVNNMMKFLKLNIFSMSYPNIKEMNDSIHSKSKPLHLLTFGMMT